MLNKTRREGLSVRDRLLGDPDGAGFLARLSFGAANLMNRFPVQRWIMEKLLGIHRKKKLPDFAVTTFEKWAERAGLMKEKKDCEAVVFQTCYVQNNEPEIGATP
jgi:Fe-S oxidoreductase